MATDERVLWTGRPAMFRNAPVGFVLAGTIGSTGDRPCNSSDLVAKMLGNLLDGHAEPND